MDKTILVSAKFEEGKKLIETLDSIGHRYPIVAWINNYEVEGWTLLFGIPNLRIFGSKETYKIIHTAIKQENVALSISDITLVDTTSEICQLLRKIIKTGFSLNRIEFSGNVINGRVLPDCIIYRIN